MPEATTPCKSLLNFLKMENKPTENRSAPDARESIAPPNKCKPCVCVFAYPFSKETQSYTENCEDYAIEYDVTLFEWAHNKMSVNMWGQKYNELPAEVRRELQKNDCLSEIAIFFTTEICALQLVIQRMVATLNLDLKTSNPTQSV